jgi:molecular chaperone DnaK (HSP70)
MEPKVPADRLEAIQTVGLLTDAKRAQAFRLIFSKIFHVTPENVGNPLTQTERDALVAQFKTLPDADKQPLFTVAEEMQKLFAPHLALGADTVVRLEKLLPKRHA